MAGGDAQPAGLGLLGGHDVAQVQLDSIPEHCRLTVQQARKFEQISRRETFNRLRAGDRREFTWAFAPNLPPLGSGRGPKQIKIVDGRSLTPGTPEAPGPRESWLRSVARDRMESSPFFEPRVRSSSDAHLTGASDASYPLPVRTPNPAPEDPHQGDLFLSPVSERMPGEYEQKRVAEWRLKLIEPCANGLYKRLGYATKGAYIEATSAEQRRKGFSVSSRSLHRWYRDYMNAGQGTRGLAALMNDKTGPDSTGPKLEPWQKLFLESERLIAHSTRERAFENLLAETAARQAAHGPGHIYHQPTKGAAFRYWTSLAESVPVAAALEGRSALKAAAMQISRTYADCYTLDRVGVDEWICDVMTYNASELVFRSGDRRGRPRVGRMNYLITMLDERSLYPLDAVLVEEPNAEAEIDLLVSVCLEYGVPGLINSDRGRFRGRTFGGRFREFDRDKAREKTQGILDRLNIGRNMPREHNPQGNRLERFHLEIARFCRTLPGWCGNSPEERDEKSNVEAAVAAHEEWIRGKRPSTPLLSQDELLAKIKGFFAWWRNEHYSEGTDMNGLAPQMVFDRNRPPEGLRRVTPAELDAVTAVVYREHLIKPGGVIEISEGHGQVTPYFSHELTILPAGERRTVTRSRYDRSKVTVHGLHPDDPPIIVPAVRRVGVSDPELLSHAIAEKKFSRGLLEAAVERPKEDNTISSIEMMMRHGRPPALDPIAPPRSIDRLKTSEEVAREVLALWEMQESEAGEQESE